MMVSLRHRLVLFAMPKCASSALEQALSSHMDIVITGHPGAKHTIYGKYKRHLKRYFESFSDGPMETLCLFREPTDWLNSWWRYRGRENIPNPEHSTRNMDFDSFVEAYLDNRRPPANLGRQSRFVSDPDGGIGIDRLFRYEDAGTLLHYICERMDLDVSMRRYNVSPDAHAAETLRPETLAALRTDLALDFEIYESLPTSVSPAGQDLPGQSARGSISRP